MDFAQYLAVLESESRWLLDVVRSMEPGTPVPSCPGWSAADLTWHLAEVQYFWAAVVAGSVTDPQQVEDLGRPSEGDLPDLLEDHSVALVAALSGRSPEEPCWSWHQDGHSIGWVARRQAHEALIHRVDGELAAGHQGTPAPADLAADGVDEVLGVMLHTPDWGSFARDGVSVEVSSTDPPQGWILEFGRFTGTSPLTGRSYDLDSARVISGAHEADASVRGRAWDLDLWLWGRAGDDAVRITGDPAGVTGLRAVLAENTQ